MIMKNSGKAYALTLVFIAGALLSHANEATAADWDGWQWGSATVRNVGGSESEKAAALKAFSKKFKEVLGNATPEGQHIGCEGCAFFETGTGTAATQLVYRFPLLGHDVVSIFIEAWNATLFPTPLPLPAEPGHPDLQILFAKDNVSADCASAVPNCQSMPWCPVDRCGTTPMGPASCGSCK